MGEKLYKLLIYLLAKLAFSPLKEYGRPDQRRFGPCPPLIAFLSGLLTEMRPKQPQMAKT
ncbi:MAG: hypothetical protein ABIY37_01475 [Devosia sp.]